INLVNAQDSSLPRNTQLQLQRRDRIHQEEHLTLIDGKLYKMLNGVRTQVENQVQLRNGGVINPDGSYLLKNGSQLQLHNGECLDMEGNLYLNQRNFGKGQKMSQRQIRHNENMNIQRNRMNQNQRPRIKN
ncbi:MAG TPA: DUF6799 domain-containing protein, partial [Flavisolibacter sp.]|nr:DUF6799 domain-containing protein [Flavisolibacter sp.]